MGLFERFPYTNFHELNAGWMLEVMKRLEEAWEQFTAGNSLSFADPLTYAATKSYAKNTIVLDGSGNAYISLQTVPKGVAPGNQDYWLMVFDYEAFMEKVNKNFTGRYYRDENRAKTAMAIGDWLTFEDVLCKATAAIAVDDLLEVGGNIEHFTLEDFIKAFMTSATNMIQQYKNDIDYSEAQYRAQLAQDIADTTASLQAQLDAAISGATVDSEVINARIGFDNTTYATLGEAIRTQVKEEHDRISNASGKIDGLEEGATVPLVYNQSMVTTHGALIYDDGTIVTTYSSHDLIAIEDPEIESITFDQVSTPGGAPACVVMYDGDVASYINFSTAQDQTILLNFPHDVIYLNWIGAHTASPYVSGCTLKYRSMNVTEDVNLVKAITTNTGIKTRLADLTLIIGKYAYIDNGQLAFYTHATHSCVTMPSDDVRSISWTNNTAVGSNINEVILTDSGGNILDSLKMNAAGDYTFNIYEPVTGGTIYINFFNYQDNPVKYFDTIYVKNYDSIIDPIVDLMHSGYNAPKSLNLADAEVLNADAFADIDDGNLIFVSSSSHDCRKMSAKNVTEVQVKLKSDFSGTSLYTVIVVDENNNVLQALNARYAGIYTLRITDPDAYMIIINFFAYNTSPNPYYDTINYIDYPVITRTYNNDLQKMYNRRFKTIVSKPFDFRNHSAIFVGDSICYGSTSGTTDVHGSGDYPKLFSDAVGMSYSNNGITGALFTSGYNLVTTIVQQVQNIVTMSDFLFIEGGVNDWALGVDLDDFRTAIQTLCTYINTNYPDLPVIWITPINEAGWETVRAISPIATLQTYRDLMTELILTNNVNSKFSVIQGTDFDFPDIEGDASYISAMFGDLLHPSALGYKSLYTTGLLNALM